MKIFKILLGTLSFSLLCVALFYHTSSTLGICFGALWGGGNLYLLKQILQALLIEKKGFKILLLALAKFPILYALGFALLQISQISPWDLLIGLTLSLAIFIPHRLWEQRNV